MRALRKNDLNDAQAMQQQMAMGMDTGKAFVAVKESLDMMDHEFQLHVAERRAGRLLKKSAMGAAKADARRFRERRQKRAENPRRVRARFVPRSPRA